MAYIIYTLTIKHLDTHWLVLKNVHEIMHTDDENSKFLQNTGFEAEFLLTFFGGAFDLKVSCAIKFHNKSECSLKRKLCLKKLPQSLVWGLQ